MKKFLTAAVCALIACVFAVCLGGCSNSKMNGKYYLSNAAAQNGGAVYYLTEQDENGLYKNINGQIIVPENFWVELNGKTMTVHGSITTVVSGEVITFNVNQDSSREIKYTLEKKESNKYWYDIYENGEYTNYSVEKDGDGLIFQINKLDAQDYWFNISYDKK